MFIVFVGEEMTSWKKADVAAGLLATVPHTAAKESYYVNICDQIITLLQSPQVDKSEYVFFCLEHI